MMMSDNISSDCMQKGSAGKQIELYQNKFKELSFRVREYSEEHEKSLEEDEKSRDMKEAFQILQKFLEQGIPVTQIFKLYLELFISSNKNYHRDLFEIHLQIFLSENSFSKYSNLTDFYACLMHIFNAYRYLLFRLLQSRQYIFLSDSLDAMALYQEYIRFAISRRNDKLILKDIEEQAASMNFPLSKLTVLLKAYVWPLPQLTFRKIFFNFCEMNAQWEVRNDSQRKQLLNFTAVFFQIRWLDSLNKSTTILKFLPIWDRVNNKELKKLINKILKHVVCTEEDQPVIGDILKRKLMETVKEPDSQVNCQFLFIFLKALSVDQLNTMLEKEALDKSVDELLKGPMNEWLIELLMVLKSKNVHGLGSVIEATLGGTLEQAFTAANQIQENKLISALNIFRFFKITDANFLKIYETFESAFLQKYKHVHGQMEVKKHILALCFSILKQPIEREWSIRIFKSVLDIVGQHTVLKILMIEEIKSNMNEQFYDKKYFEVFREPRYHELLRRDCAGIHMQIKIFSLKLLGFLSEDPHSTDIPFLRQCYYHLKDRLLSLRRRDTEEKITCLRLIRQIIGSRAELFEIEGECLSEQLSKELSEAMQFYSYEEMNLSIQIFKNLQAIMKKLPQCITKQARTVAHFIIVLINSRTVKKELKVIALETFSEIISSLNYVILPYFHFPNLFSTVREIFRADDRYYFYLLPLLKLIGRLGYIHAEQFATMRILGNSEDPKIVENAFEVVFKEIGYIRYAKQHITAPAPLKSIEADSPFFSVEEISTQYVQLENYLPHVLLKIGKHFSASSSRLILEESYKAIDRIIFTLKAQHHQLFQDALLPKLLEYQHRYPHETRALMFKIMQSQDVSASAAQILRKYVRNLSQLIGLSWRKEDRSKAPEGQKNTVFHDQIAILRIIYEITKNYPKQCGQESRLIVLTLKGLLLETWQQNPATFHLSLAILCNIAQEIEHTLHLFLQDFNKLLLKLPRSQCEMYFTFLMCMAQKTMSMEYYLPSICEYLLGLLRQKLQSYRPDWSYNERIFLHKIVDFCVGMISIYGERCKQFFKAVHYQLSCKQVSNLFFEMATDFSKKQHSLDYLYTAYTSNQLIELRRHHFRIEPIPVGGSPPTQADRPILQLIIKFSDTKSLTQEEEELWLYDLGLALFINSPQPLLRACAELARLDKSLIHDLFHVGFYFFWMSLNRKQVEMGTRKLKGILLRELLSLKVKQKLLDSVYFVERCQQPILIQDKILSEIAFEVLDQAKSLFYLEREYQKDPEEYAESLINMYITMGQFELGVGLLKTASNIRKNTKIIFYQKLNSHREALKEYDGLEDKSKPENVLLQIIMKKEQCEWEWVSKACNKPVKGQQNSAKIAYFAIEANINLGRWDLIKEDQFPNAESPHENANLWLAMLKTFSGSYQEAERLITQDREQIYIKICQMFNFSYERSMKSVVRLQQLSELEEIIDFFRFKQKAEQFHLPLAEISRKKEKLISLWSDRIEGASKNLVAMQEILLVRSLLLQRIDNIANWIVYCKLALKQGQTALCDKVLNLVDLTKISDARHRFEIQLLQVETKFNRGQSKDEESVERVKKLVDTIGVGEEKKYVLILQEVYLKCAMWLSEKEDDFRIQIGLKIIEFLKCSLKINKEYVEAWHMMGLTHIKILELYEEEHRKIRTDKKVNLKDDELETSFRKEKELREKDSKQNNVCQALNCFLESVKCSVKGHKFFLEDCLKILNLVSTFSDMPRTIELLFENYEQVPADGLIEIIPQILSRLEIAGKASQTQFLDLLKCMLVYIGEKHPQTLVFPLLFLHKGNDLRRKISVQIIEGITVKKQIFAEMYRSAELISNQLCKISLKLSEKFNIFMGKQLQASRRKEQGYLQIAGKCVQFLERMLKEATTATSQAEYGFIQEYYQAFTTIINHFQCFKHTKEYPFYSEAWRAIIQIIKTNSESLRCVDKDFMQEASQELYALRQDKVCLFGSYNPYGESVYIAQFCNQIKVIDSKQRPKKIQLVGSDGKQYNYLLKGKEDLRLDERIMQLFLLVNKMFHNSSDRENYSILGYSITPLSLEVGIISWVQNCDTMGDLIQSYRRSTGGTNKSESVFLEKAICDEICEKYSALPKTNKVEIYREVESRVSGHDLRNIFWMRALNSQEWLKQRSCFTRSLAVMSIVGFIIGLGDRHPFNIMIQRGSNKVVHIDFGDCFQVNKTRKEFPEKVPFRLTRMLVKAMEPGGTQGIFQHSCEKILKTLRSNKESIFVIIQTFRYDPIIGWRLTAKGDEMILKHSYIEDNYEESIEEDSRRELNCSQKCDQKVSKSEEEESKDGKREKKEVSYSKSQSARHILKEIKNKLNGKENENSTKFMTEVDHVQRLIREAVSPSNLVQHYQGWCIFW